MRPSLCHRVCSGMVLMLTVVVLGVFICVARLPQLGTDPLRQEGCLLGGKAADFLMSSHALGSSSRGEGVPWR